MISDVLAEAVQDIKQYLKEPPYSREALEEDSLVSDINKVVAHMDAVRRKLDAPPTSD